MFFLYFTSQHVQQGQGCLHVNYMDAEFECCHFPVIVEIHGIRD